MYRESLTMSRRECSGFRSAPDSLMFSSHEIGTLKGYFSNYERYNDSDVSVSIYPGYGELEITVHSNLNKGDSWCQWKLTEALEYVKHHVIQSCSANGDRLIITIELYTA